MGYQMDRFNWADFRYIRIRSYYGEMGVEFYSGYRKDWLYAFFFHMVSHFFRIPGPPDRMGDGEGAFVPVFYDTAGMHYPCSGNICYIPFQESGL